MSIFSSHGYTVYDADEELLPIVFDILKHAYASGDIDRKRELAGMIEYFHERDGHRVLVMSKDGTMDIAGVALLECHGRDRTTPWFLILDGYRKTYAFPVLLHTVMNIICGNQSVEKPMWCDEESDAWKKMTVRLKKGTFTIISKKVADRLERIFGGVFQQQKENDNES